MLKRQRTLTPPPSDVSHGLDSGFGFRSSRGVEDDYIDATGFGHIAKRRRVTLPVPPSFHSNVQSQNWSSGSPGDDDDSEDYTEEDLHHNTFSPPPPNQTHESEYRSVNNLLRSLHLRRNYMHSISSSGKADAMTTDSWDSQLFDVTKFHSHYTAPTPQPRDRGLDESYNDSGSYPASDQGREAEEATSVLAQYQERNRLLGDAVRMRMRRQTDGSQPSR